MSDFINFFVPGKPATQGSKRAFVNKHTGRAQMQEMGVEKLNNWRSDVKSEARKCWGNPPVEGPVTVRINVLLQKPKSAPKKKVTFPVGKLSGDLDKVARAILDAMTGVVFVDDSQVTELHVTKHWSLDTTFGASIHASW